MFLEPRLLFVFYKSVKRVCYILDTRKIGKDPVLGKQNDNAPGEAETMQENLTVLENQPGPSNWNQVYDNSPDQNTRKNDILHQQNKETSGRKYATNKTKKVDTYCKNCPEEPHLCLECFNEQQNEGTNIRDQE